MLFTPGAPTGCSSPPPYPVRDRSVSSRRSNDGELQYFATFCVERRGQYEQTMPQFEYFLRSRHDVIQFGAAQSIEEGANPSEPGPRHRSTQSKNRFKKLFCPFCDKLSSDSWKFKRHLRSHSRSSGDRTAHDHDVGNEKPLSNVLTRKGSTGSGCDGNDCDSCECGCEVRPHNDSHFILKVGTKIEIVWLRGTR